MVSNAIINRVSRQEIRVGVRQFDNVLRDHIQKALSEPTTLPATTSVAIQHEIQQRISELAELDFRV